MRYELPTEAQTSAITHAKTDQVSDLEFQLEVQVYFGTINDDGTFNYHGLTPKNHPHRITVDDTEAFNIASTLANTSPESKGDPRKRFKEDLFDFISANNLWPTQS